MQVQLGPIYNTNSLFKAVSIINFPEDHSHRIQFLALRYLYQYRSMEHPRYVPSVEKLNTFAQNKVNDLFRHPELYINDISELADILLQFNPPAGQEILNRIRNFQNPQDNIVQVFRRFNIEEEKEIPVNQRTIYTDTQNVHNTEINNSVLKAASNLCNLYKHIFEKYEINDRQQYKLKWLRQIKNILTTKYSHYTYLITETIDYISSSVATFGIDISLQDVTICIWFYIQKHKDKDELEKRLIQEFDEMRGLCTTGHIARLINIIQGFTEEKEDLLIKISNKEQYNIIIRKYLTETLRNCQDEKVIEGMTDGTEIYKKYIRESIKKILLKWIDEYGKDIMLHIPEIVNNFCNIEIFKYNK